MPDDKGDCLDFIGTQRGASGGVKIAPRFLASPFIPLGYGLVWTDSNGNFWLQRLMQNADGTTKFDDNNLPQTEIVQITLP